MLKLINDYDATLINMFKITEDFSQGVFRVLHIAQLDIESGHVLSRIVAETRTEWLQESNKLFAQFFTPRSYIFENRRSENKNKLAKGSGM